MDKSVNRFYLQKLQKYVLTPALIPMSGSSHVWYCKTDSGLGPPTPLHAHMAPKVNGKQLIQKSLIVVIQQSTWLVFLAAKSSVKSSNNTCLETTQFMLKQIH